MTACSKIIFNLNADPKPYEGFLQRISTKDLFFVTDELVLPRSMISISVKIPTETTIDLIGEVASSSDYQGTCFVEVYFPSIDLNTQNLIRQHFYQESFKTTTTQHLYVHKKYHKRHLPRYEVNLKALYKSENNVFPSKTKVLDISCGGAKIIINEQAAIGEHFVLNIDLIFNRRIFLQSHVAWVKPNNQFWDVGLSFHDLTQEMQEQLLEFTYGHNKDQTVQHWFNGW
ncbi:MAG: PilZ domain-containing protein [Candidatus Omnitrophica bacterium]|nr:PilZ domain-containing protein [Candidatus Omnitrophota bacterium]